MNQHPGDRMILRSRLDREEAGRRAWISRIGIGLTNEGDSLKARAAGYVGTLLALVLTTALLWPIRETAGLLNIGLVFLTAIIGVTVVAGQGAGILASVLGFGLFDFFLVPPYLTFAIGDLRNILALFVFLGVSLLISWLIAGAREQARQASRRAEDVSRLYELSRTIIASENVDEILPAIARKVTEVFEAQSCWILLPNQQQQLVVKAHAPKHAREISRDEMALATWAFWQGQEVAQSDTSRDHASALPKNRAAFVPLHGAERTIGVLAVADKPGDHPFTRAERTVLATFADQAAVALERLYLMREAARADLLARTDELKSALMSAVSHDLRTPLASIMASVTSLMETDIEWDEETQHDFLQGIYDEALRLNKLVGNLLDMSRIEGGAIQPEMDWYDIAEVIEGVAARLDPRLKEHPVTLQIEDDLPLMLFDFTQIDQVLTNLVENAIKYTPPGTSITIRARIDDNRLLVQVEDNGPGVPLEHLPHLFDKFYQVARGKQKRGTGLGLAITKGLVEAHGGRISAANIPGGGLIVTFSLPIQVTPTAGRVAALAGKGW